MLISEQVLEAEFQTRAAYNKIWFKLVEEIAELEEQVSDIMTSRDDDAMMSLTRINRELSRKRLLLKRLDLS